MSSVREDTAKKMFLAMLIADNTDEDIEITDKDWDEFVLHHGDVSFWLDQADQLLSHPRIAILAEDQSEPDILQRDRDTLDPEDYQYAQGVRYMWNANFKRIEK